MSSETEAQSSTRKALIAVSAVGLVLFVFALPVFGVRFALSTAFGSALGVGNLYLISRGVQAFLGGGTPGAWTVVALFKLSALLGLVYAVFTFRWVEGLPLLIGLGALPLGVVVSQLTGTRHPMAPPRRF